MQVAARLGWEEIDWGTPLVRALAAGALPEPLAGPRHPTARPDIDAGFLQALVADLDPALRGPWLAFQEPGARAVVAGQQPGCAGGALLVLHKAATAVALARRLAARMRTPVVPVFWNATDDEDFDEIAQVAWPDAERGLLFLELPRDARRAGGWVGDLPAAGDQAAFDAALALLPEAERAALAAFAPERAADHGSWVAGFLSRVFPELAIVDARSPVLRRYGAPLFARYLERQPQVVAAVERGGAALAALGFAPTLSRGSAGAALYLTGERRRRKVGDDLEPLRQALGTAPEDLSPNVVLRPLLQDVLLPTVAHVVGPAEIGYLLELRPLREVLEVPEPALVPRLSMTALPAPAWEASRDAGIGAAALVADPRAALQAAARDSTRAAAARLESAWRTLATDLAALPLTQSGSARATKRLDGLLGELRGDLETAARDALVARAPVLGRLDALLRPRGRPQERLVAALWLLARWGNAAPAHWLEIATQHLEGLESRRPEHPVVLV